MTLAERRRDRAEMRKAEKSQAKFIRKGESKVFDAINYIILTIIALLCIFPIINVLAISFSSSTQAAMGTVSFWPKDFTTAAYEYALSKPQFSRSFIISVVRVVLGVSVQMFFTVLAAYPLSKNTREFRMRNIYIWFFFITTMISGGMIPTYMVVKETGLMDTIWALIIPGAVPVFNIILLLNFFRQLPQELYESALMDGAGHMTILFKVYLPLSLPSLATLTLFTAVGHWNSWFDGMIYMSSQANYPLQTYLQSLMVVKDVNTTQLVSKDEMLQLAALSDKTVRAAQIFIATLPILMVYPFVQRFFMKGLVIGSVKG